MSTERVSHAVDFLPQIRPEYIWPQDVLKRKLGSFLPPIGKIGLGYPSPPMSSPPSPSRSASELARGTITGSNHMMTAPTPPPPYLPPLAHSASLSLPPPPRHPSFDHTPPVLGSSNTVLYPPLGPMQSAPRVMIDSPLLGQGSTVHTTSSARPGRKSKAHVASACINCKRAHLSCDVERPCTRCVASGKQDTCYDVQHKKRGRPRLRDGDSKTEQHVAPRSASTTGFITEASSNPRPHAGTKHRRVDSLRSLRSQPADGGSTRSILSSTFGPPQSQSQFLYHQPPPPSPALATPEVPTAFMDLDLVILRANRAFQQIMAHGQEIRGRDLGEIASPIDNESFSSIRARLRSEREGREPAHMPPMVHAGQDQLLGVTDGDVDRLTQSFADHTYRWRRSSTPNIPSRSLPARVRLAKAENYFVVVTLPGFGPVSPKPPMPMLAAASDPPAMTERSSPGMRLATESAPPQGYYPYPISARASPQQQIPMESRPYSRSRIGPQLQAPKFYQPLQGPSTPQFHTAEPRPTPTTFGSRSFRDEILQSPPLSLQLPPLGTGRRPSSALAAPEYAKASEPQTWTEEEDKHEEDQSPRKKRRMGIDNILQR